MHDPSTVAFDIKYPWRSKKPSKLWPKGYRATFITIWHEDPEDFRGKLGVRGDDSCGWFSPPYSEADRDRMMKLAASEYRDIFGRQHATADGKSYAYICFEPSCYDAVYWCWRAIKYNQRKRPGWKYGERRPALTANELEEIYLLASNPIDNLRSTFDEVKDVETFQSFFMLVYRAWRRFNRPWYHHPRWHFWHWRFQIHPLQKLNRRLFHRCAECGKHFGWNESPVGNWNGDARWHEACYPRPDRPTYTETAPAPAAVVSAVKPEVGRHLH